MGIVRINRRQLRWPPALLALASAIAVLAAMVGDPGAVRAAAALLVLSAALLTVLARRSARGAHATPAVWWASAILAWIAGSIVLVLAPNTVAGAVLLAIGVLFMLAVALFGFVVLTSVTDPPEWMLDGDGQLPGLRERMSRAVGHFRLRLQQRPNRSPERIYAQISRDMRRMVWHAGAADACAFPHFHVVLHPDTLQALDAWMAVEDVAAELAQGYADAHGNLRRRSSLVVVLISSDPHVPLGEGAVAASFREQRADAPRARAWATLVGPVQVSELSHAQRLGAPAMVPALASTRQSPVEDAVLRDDPTAAFLAQDGDRTRILPGAGQPARPVAPRLSQAEVSAAVTVAGPATEETSPVRPPTSGVLRVRQCLPGGVEMPGAQEYQLQATRTWTLGRDRSADLTFTQPYISREHVQFVPLEGGWAVVERSRFGTSLNGTPLEFGTPTPVRPGDILEFGYKAQIAASRVLLLVA